MTGQDAVRSAAGFAAALPLTGIILTKTDGDARGGAALSVVSTVGKPIKFVGVGEKPEDFEPFHPDRMASRILGLGDVLTLIEKVEAQVDASAAEKLARARHERASSRSRTCATSSRSMKKMGPLSGLLDLLPQGRAFRGLAAARRRRREVARPHRRDHRLDDPRGAAVSAAPERQPQEADRRRLGHVGRRDQPADQAVPADAEADEGREEGGPGARPVAAAASRPRN